MSVTFLFTQTPMSYQGNGGRGTQKYKYRSNMLTEVKVWILSRSTQVLTFKCSFTLKVKVFQIKFRN